jgi:hypothetical protein
MTRVAERKDYNGATERIQRLGLQSLWNELEKVLTGFQPFIRDATYQLLNSTHRLMNELFFSRKAHFSVQNSC